MPSASTSCGFSWLGYPKFLQPFATTRAFIIVWGLLGTVQSMGFVYFVITLQTMEKRFKIPSQTTGLILSGNEISQILLSVILAYFGGQRNRPRLISWGVIFCAISSIILALPHFLYGAGEDALRLTKEYGHYTNTSVIDTSAVDKLFRESNRLCSTEKYEQFTDDDIESIVPLVLVFLSQFVLGIGTTLYYALGQTYLDDNTKKSNTPLLLSYAFALRTAGPAVGFVLGFTALKIYIDPTKTPLIDSKDPRWMGAWWLGWCFFTILFFFIALLIGLFPKHLPKKRQEAERQLSSTIPRIMKSQNDLFNEETKPLKSDLTDVKQFSGSMIEIPTMRQFPAVMARLFRNKVLMSNIASAIFYILGASGYFTFMSKYLEVQFHKSAADATIITGPFMIVGVVTGLLLSGYIISKKKPSPSKLLFWNVIVGVIFMFGQVSYLFFTCPDGDTPLAMLNGKLNLDSSCNSGCHCDGIPYTPVCNEETGNTYFSACHAGCNDYSKTEKYYSECQCILKEQRSSTISEYLTTLPSSVTESTKSIKSNYSSINSSTNELVRTESSTSIVVQLDAQKDKILSQNESTTLDTNYDDVDYGDDTEIVEDDIDLYAEEKPKDKVRRSLKEEEPKKVWAKLIPGACIKGCAIGFYAFTAISSIINCFGASGKIGNILVNYRCVSSQDKSVTQGLFLMLVSLFALIPGPIMYGRIIDSTCLVWTQSSGRLGNCQLYDQRLFRYYVNLSALILTSIGVFFDVLVWKYGRNLDLYGEREQEMLQKKSNNKNAFSI